MGRDQFLHPKATGQRRHGHLVTVAFLLIVAACGDGSGDRSTTAIGDVDAAGSPATTTTQPAASDEDAVRPHIEELLGRWDEHMTALLADPESVADDPDHPIAREMAEAFTENSPYIANLSIVVSEMLGEPDVAVRPGPKGVSQDSTLLSFLQASSAQPDLVAFMICSYHDGIAYTRSTGEEHPPNIGIRQMSGQALREDGRWLLHRLDELRFRTEPPGTSNPCSALSKHTEADEPES